MIHREIPVPSVTDEGTAGYGWLIGESWSEVNAQANRQGMRWWVKDIARDILLGSADCLQEAELLVETLGRWLRESRQGVMSTVHDHFRNVSVRSHAICVSLLMMNLADEIGLPEDRRRELGVAGFLHDIGKLRIPDAILDKPTRLDETEIAEVRKHADSGVELLERCGIASPVVLDVCRFHHERLDGSGYPQGIRGDDLSFSVRAAGICDVYDALISHRTYKARWTQEAALAEIRKAGNFDGGLVECFTRSLECLGDRKVFPTG